MVNVEIGMYLERSLLNNFRNVHSSRFEEPMKVDGNESHNSEADQPDTTPIINHRSSSLNPLL